MYRVDKDMRSKNDEKHSQFLRVILSSILLSVIMPQTVKASEFAMESWSDATVCRLVGEQHKLVTSVQFRAEASRRKLNCLNKRILSKGEEVADQIAEDTSSIEKHIKLVNADVSSERNINNTLSEQLINPTRRFVDSNSEFQTDESVIGSLKPQMAKRKNNDMTKELRPKINDTSITDSPAKKSNRTIYSWLSIVTVLMAACGWYISRKEKISTNEILITTEYDASNKVVQLRKIKSGLVSSFSKLDSFE